MKSIVLYIGFLVCFTKVTAQFQFSGVVNDDFKNATVYLSIVNDCNKKNLFFTEHILLESQINSTKEFEFKGDLLANENRIYKIHIDNCNNNISDYKHLLNHCEDSKEIIFIANNTDTIHFPLNNISQMFCDMEYKNIRNSALFEIDTMQEELLSKLQYSKSDLQRKNMYRNHFKALQKFSKTFNEPLAELYAFYLYANDHAISKDFYLEDLKKSSYYNNLLQKLEAQYKNTTYLNHFKNTLVKDQYPMLKTKKSQFQWIAYALGLLLFLSLIMNFFQLKKSKKYTNKIEPKIDYKTVLTTQEQNVFELMNQHSNKEIAEKLFVSLSTIKSHINNIYSKLSISSRKEIDRFLN
ncbi:MAG: LuxR C-terminal-related transcriptional regulator [Flavobacteriaceae bacterium]